MKQPLTPGAFQNLTDVDDETLERLSVFLDLLAKWQRRINLVSRESLGDPWRRHLLDSAQLAPLLPDRPARLIDIGSGAGFPGLVLAVVATRRVDLVEADGRKCIFLREAARLIQADVVVHNQRVEALQDVAADVVLARGCAPLPTLLAYMHRLRARGGYGLFLKGARVAAELTEAEKAWMMRVTSIPSRSDPSGTILKIEDLQRRDDSRPH